mmetsp:Transcript_9872/g.26258  ORF Transcript_9872/g.26258 Transcript_9872/m.26258 type:complete len:124 (-) Transcript_9872:616-987(-)
MSARVCGHIAVPKRDASAVVAVAVSAAARLTRSAKKRVLVLRVLVFALAENDISDEQRAKFLAAFALAANTCAQLPPGTPEFMLRVLIAALAQAAQRSAVVARGVLVWAAAENWLGYCAARRV